MTKSILNKFTEIEKRQLIIFFLVAFLIPVILSFVMAYNINNEANTTVFPLTFMMLPSAGAILAMLLTKQSNTLPITFFKCYLVFTAIMLLLCLLNILAPLNIATFSQVVLLSGSIITLIFLANEKKESKEAYNLNYIKKKNSWIYMLLFIFLLLLRSFIILLISADVNSFYSLVLSRFNLGVIIILAITFFTSYIIFFGEEYGWRFFLQTML